MGLAIPSSGLIPNSALAELGAQANLCQGPRPAKGFGDHAGQTTDHGGAAVDQGEPLRLFLVDHGGSRGFGPEALAGLVGVCGPAPWRF